MQTAGTRSLLALALALASGCAMAHDHPQRDGHDWEDSDQSFDRARRASARGEILPIARIYALAAARVPGRVLEAELERKHGRWVYELKVLDQRGRIMELDIDGRSGEFLKQEED